MVPIRIFPIILAAGGPGKFGSPKPLARFGSKTALQLAIENCAGLEPPVVVLGHRATAVGKSLPAGVHTIVNRKWRRGQLTSLLAALDEIPREAAFVLYPVDQPLLTRNLIARLARAFAARTPQQTIVMPRARKRAGHPIVCDAALRRELYEASTAREVVYREQARIRYVAVRDTAIWLDFDSAASYERCLRHYLRRNRREHHFIESLNVRGRAASAPSESGRRVEI